MEKNDQLDNFRKVNFSCCGIEYELGISIYSKLIFIILTDTCKLGNIYIGELDDEDIITEEDSDFLDIKCILGDRSNEESQFLANFIINYIFAGLKKANKLKIQNILVSSSLRKNSYSDEQGLNSDYQKFMLLVKQNVATLLNI
jgi:hypothetical protein